MPTITTNFSIQSPVNVTETGLSVPELNLEATDLLGCRVSTVALRLSGDSEVAVPLGSFAGVNVLGVVSSKKVRARITSADGTDAEVPVDGAFFLVSRSVPLTAIKITRVAGTETDVTVVLGELE